jgi:hypothetical protein
LNNSNNFNNRYIVSMLPTNLSTDLPFLPAFGCGLRREFSPIDSPRDPRYESEIHELNFWFSSGKTHSVLHYDMNNQIMCQIVGEKDWRFWDLRSQSGHIPMWSGFYPDHLSSDDSPIDPVDIDLVKFSGFIDAKWTNTTLRPGECLLIPARHALHYVRGRPGRNIGFSVHSSLTDSPVYHDCDSIMDGVESLALSGFDVIWPFPGDPGESEYEEIRMGKASWKRTAVVIIQSLMQRRGEGVTTADLIEFIRGEMKLDNVEKFLEEIKNKEISSFFKFEKLWREIDSQIHPNR